MCVGCVGCVGFISDRTVYRVWEGKVENGLTRGVAGLVNAKALLTNSALKQILGEKAN